MVSGSVLPVDDGHLPDSNADRNRKSMALAIKVNSLVDSLTSMLYSKATKGQTIAIDAGGASVRVMKFDDSVTSGETRTEVTLPFGHIRLPKITKTGMGVKVSHVS